LRLLTDAHVPVLLPSQIFAKAQAPEHEYKLVPLLPLILEGAGQGADIEEEGHDSEEGGHDSAEGGQRSGQWTC
jgi:hypothetical protein